MSVDIANAVNDNLLFDVIVFAELEVSEIRNRNRKRDTDWVNQWFRVSCKAKLNDGLKEFSILRISLYNNYK